MPRPLLIGFATFVVAMVALVAASLRRREAPVRAPSSATRVRAAGWERAGDTLTLDATDAERWRRASLALGRALAASDTATWEIAARRHRITVAGAIADLGAVAWDSVRVPADARWVASRPQEDANAALAHWYRYDFTTHLLEADGRVFALRSPSGRLWKLQVLGYYCPGVRAGCLTLRYAPLDEAG
jgi:hypothetical protein